MTTRQLGQLVGVALASGVWSWRLQAYEGSLLGEPALGLAFRDRFLVLALVAATGAVISWRGDRKGATAAADPQREPIARARAPDR